MAVTNVRYSDVSNVPLIVSYDSEPDVNMAQYPSGTWRDAGVQEWLDAGNTIQPYDRWYGMTLDEVKEVGYAEVDAELAKRVDAAEHNPSAGVNLSDSATRRENAKRDNKAKRKNNKISDADDHLYDHLTELADFAESDGLDVIEACSDTACVQAVIDSLPSLAWPTWSPM